MRILEKDIWLGCITEFIRNSSVKLISNSEIYLRELRYLV